MGRLRIAVRVAAMFAWLALCVPLHLAMKALFGRSRVPRVFLAGIGFIAGVRIAVRGTPPDGRAILVANHVSWLDIPILAAATGSVFIAHDGLAGSRLLKWLCEMNDTVFIARSRRATVARQVDQVREAVDRSRVVTLFAEGTTSNGTDLLPLKSSLLSAIDPPPPGVAIQPVWIDFGRDAAAIAWLGDEPGLANFFKVLARPGDLPVTLHFLAPLQGGALAGRKAMAEAVQRALHAAIAAR